MVITACNKQTQFIYRTKKLKFDREQFHFSLPHTESSGYSVHMTLIHTATEWTRLAALTTPRRNVVLPVILNLNKDPYRLAMQTYNRKRIYNLL